MTDEREDAERQAACDRATQRMLEPDVPAWLDVRAMDFSLSLSVEERFRRLNYTMQIHNLAQFADRETLHKVTEVLKESAAKNPFWNGGKQKWEWVADLYPQEES